MIEPWQVWLSDLDPVEGHEQAGTRPVVVVSSELHIQSQQGRSVMICPITSRDHRVRNRVRVLNHRGEPSFVITDQIRFISTRRFLRSEPWWTLSDEEIYQVRRILPSMLDI